MRTKSKIDSDRSTFSPTIFNIQYPNCRTGMFSLRTPYAHSTQASPDIDSFAPIHPEYLHIRRNLSKERPLSYRSLQHDAQVQCSLPLRDDREEIFLPRQQTPRIDVYRNQRLSPRYRVQLKLQPTQANIYEAWHVETPPPRSISLHQPRTRQEPPVIRVRTPRLVNIQSLSDDDDDDDDFHPCVVCARYPQRTYLPQNVRTVCWRQNVNTIRY